MPRHVAAGAVPDLILETWVKRKRGGGGRMKKEEEKERKEE
jgi:hypothetical protein